MSDAFLQSIPLSIPDVLLSSHLVMDGEPVDATTTNRLPQVNARNTARIHHLIKKFRDLSGEYLRQMLIAPDVRIGDFVYFDIHAHVFDRGSAKFTVAGEQVYESESSQVWGVVIDIRNDKADICTSGLCTFLPTTEVFANSRTPAITNIDVNLPGWLPANHPIFEGKAPADAA